MRLAGERRRKRFHVYEIAPVGPRYGNRAFGMRLAAWLSHSPASQRALVVLGFALLKKSGYAFISSEQIAALAGQAATAKRDVLRLREIGETNNWLH